MAQRKKTSTDEDKKQQDVASQIEKQKEKQEKAVSLHEEAKSNDDVPKEKSFSGYAHIDNFIEVAKIMFGLSPGQAEGFRVYMNGKHYQYEDKDFVPYLEEYLGKKLDI